MTIKAILFDHDGTLVDSEVIHARLWAEVVAPFGAALSVQQYKSDYAGIPTAANAVDIVQHFGLSVSPDALVEAMDVATRAFLSRQAFPLMPGVQESIAFFLGCGLRLAVVTGAGPDGANATIRAYALHSSFSTVVSGDDVRHSKPAPDCYELAMRRLGVVSTQCVAIEDTEYGVAAATTAGIECLAIPTAMSEHHNFARAVGTFCNLGEATEWIANRFALQG